MRIGLDFDNTIVSYDTLFHAVAVAQGHIPASVAADKNAVRDWLRNAGKEDIWTQLQGYVYGARMQEAQAYPDAVAVMSALKRMGHQLFIVSHKTRHPYLGPAYDLHGAARAWIASHLEEDAAPLVAQEDVHFHERKEDKIASIAALGCEAFLDDLPEILLHEEFPSGTKRFLFSTQPANSPLLHAVGSWRAFAMALTA